MRPQRDLGSRRRSRCSRSSALAELVALPAFGLFFSGVGWRTVAAFALADIGICAVGTLTGAMAVAGRARELILPLLFLPLVDPDRRRRASARASRGGTSTSRFLALYDAVFGLLSWGAFEYVVAET